MQFGGSSNTILTDISRQLVHLKNDPGQHLWHLTSSRLCLPLVILPLRLPGPLRDHRYRLLNLPGEVQVLDGEGK